MISARTTAVTKVVILVLAVTICAAGDAFLSTCRADQILPAAGQLEGRFELHKPIPVGIIAGTAEHPKLAEIEWIRFETTYGNAWGVTARVGWSLAQDARWQIGVELLNEKRQLLKHSRDEATEFTAKAGQPEQSGMRYADLSLGYMHDQGRRHASRFRVYLEPAGKQAPVTAADAGKHTLEIVAVREDNQQPIPDATVLVTAGRIERARTSSTLLYATDAEGKCRVELPKDRLSTLRIVVQKEGFASMEQSWSNEEAPLTGLPSRHVMEMLTAQPIGGVVHDEEGNPIAGVEVKISAYLEETSGRISLDRSVQADANGCWRVDSVPSDIDRISLRLKHLEYVSDYSYSRQISAEQLRRAQALKHVEVMKKGIPLKGRVLDDQGRPLSGATVIMAPKTPDGFWDGYAYTLTDQSGRFGFGNARNDLAALPSERGLTALIVEAPGYAAVMKQVTVGPELELVEFGLKAGRTISGRVIDQQGQPITQAWTVVEPLQGYRGYSVWLQDTDEQGRFRVPNAPDDGVLLTVGKRGYIAVRQYALAPSEQEPAITMKPAVRIGGKVTDAETGKPIPNFEVATMFSGRRISSCGFAEGRYEITFDEAQPQQFELQVSAIGYRASDPEALDISQGKRTIDFKLARDPSFDAKGGKYRPGERKPTGPRKITGVVRDEKGDSVADATVIARPSMGQDVVTDSQGKFKIRYGRELGPGQKTVYFIIRHKQRNLAAALELEEDVDNLDVKLAPGVILSGKVVGEDGKGIADVEMSLTFWVGDYGYGGREETDIDEAGHFKIRAIPAGHRYSVEAGAKGYGRQYVQVRTTEAVDNQMQLEPLVLAVANLSVSGVVVDADGKPVAGARLGLSGRGQPDRYDIPTDEQGRFLVEGVCAGPLRLNANVRGETQLYGSVETEGGATDVKIVVSERGSSGRFVPKKPPSLLGKPLPQLKDLGIELPPADIQGKMVLVCFWDMQQRPSRNCMMQLSTRAQELKAKDVFVVAVQASKIDDKTLKEWVKENNIPFAVGMIQANQEQTRFNWGVKSLPWLILTDKEHVVTAEGFGLTELNDKIIGAPDARNP
jgi:protocatechuate 3,4-dioxygenase beta subunit